MIMKFSAALATVALFLATGVQAYHQLPSRYAEQRRGNQFVTGPCTADSDCQQGCCGFSSGKCAGPAVAQTNGSGGCGHGNAAPNCDVATLLGFQSQCIAGAVQGDLTDPDVIAAAKFAANLDGIKFDPSSASSGSTSSSSGGSSKDSSSCSKDSSSSTDAASSSDNSASSSSSSSSATSVSALAALQKDKAVVFSACAKDSDCQQGCCGFSTGKCAGPAVAQTNGSGGCGHGNAAPNCDVATLLGFQSQCVAGAKNGNLNAQATQAAAAFAAQLDGLSFKPSASSSSSSSGSSSSASSSSDNSSSSSGTKSAAALAASQQSKATVFSACTADADCQQGCCGFATGKCAGPAVAQTNGSGGCGHGNAAPNCDVATLLGFQSQCVAGHKNGNLDAPATQAAAAFAAQLDGLKFSPS